MSRLTRISLLCSLIALVAFPAARAHAQGSLIIINDDGPGEGFNDPTVVTPIGGNTATTLGAQRLQVFEYVASIWGAVLQPPVDIHIRARFDELSCTATTGALGQAGATTLFSDFPNAPVAATWYPAALANQLAGEDLLPESRRSDGAEISAQFNSDVGEPGCLEDSGWYLGLDGAAAEDEVDLAAVVLHEVGHGLGFASYVNERNGTAIRNRIDIYSRNLFDLDAQQTWAQMGTRARKLSAINTRRLVWNGPAVTTAVPVVLELGVPAVVVASPPAIAGSYDAGEAEFGPALTSSAVSGAIVQALDGSGSTTDACETITNTTAVSGKIALVDRGTCTFVTKALNAQAAGATAMIVVNNVASEPAPGMATADGGEGVTIPAASVTLSDGSLIKSQLGTGVQGAVGLDMTRRAGADATTGKALVYTPNPVEPGSSISHWDFVARPNQLMEPFLSSGLGHNPTVPFDLTYELLKDIGWPVAP